MRARVRGVSYSDESLKGTRRPRFPVLVPCVVYPQLSCACQPPFDLSEALLARCCCLRRCRAADSHIVFARHSQFHFSAIANAEHMRVCTRRWHNSCVSRHRTYPDTTRTQVQLELLQLELLHEKMSCCRCNRTGICKGCACVKAGIPCTNCLPNRLGSCENCSSTRSRIQQQSTVSTQFNAHQAISQPVTGATATAAAAAAAIAVVTPVSTTIPATTASGSSTNSSPAFTPVSSTPFHWGDATHQSFCENIGKAYEEQTLWRKNTFSPPSGHAGTEFVKEHTWLLRAYKDRTPMERVALQAVMVMPSLLLQKPYPRAGSKEFSQHLTWRLALWKAGNIKELLEEARTIQSRLPGLDRQRGTTTTKLNRRFAALIRKGEIHAAISLITEHGKGGILNLTPEV